MVFFALEFLHELKEYKNQWLFFRDAQLNWVEYFNVLFLKEWQMHTKSDEVIF